MSHQSDWIYYKQPIKFLVFVADTCNMIFLFVSFQWYLDTFVFHGQVVAIKTDESVTCSHCQNKQTRSQSSGTSRKGLDLSFLNVFILIFYIHGNFEKREFLAVFLKTPGCKLNCKPIRLDFEVT